MTEHMNSPSGEKFSLEAAQIRAKSAASVKGSCQAPDFAHINSELRKSTSSWRGPSAAAQIQWSHTGGEVPLSRQSGEINPPTSSF